MSDKHVLECNYPNGPMHGPGCICPKSGSSRCSSAREYRIVTIADAFEQIPSGKIDAFLADLGGMMKYHKSIEEALSQLAKSEIKTSLQKGFVWIDDGKHDLKFIVG